MSENHIHILGDPLDAIHFKSEKKAPAANHKDEISQNRPIEPNEKLVFREGDTGLGQPDYIPTSEQRENIHTLSEDETKRLYQENEKVQLELEKKLADIERAGTRIPKIVLSVFGWTLVFISAILSLFMLNQGLELYFRISVLSIPFNYVALSFFLILCFLVFYVIFKVFRLFFKFKSNTNIDLKALTVLEERTKLRLLAKELNDSAKGELTKYVTDYNMGYILNISPEMNNNGIKELENYKNNLLGEKSYINSSEWLKDFKNTFVQTLDMVANKQIKVYTKAVSIGTAASPVKFIDQMIVMYSSFKLINDLILIYNLRPAFGQSATIIARSIIQAYLSGVIGETFESGGQMVSEHIMENTYGDLGASIGSGFIGTLAPKIAEGGLNGFLVYRLGKQAQKMLRPI